MMMTMTILERPLRFITLLQPPLQFLELLPPTGRPFQRDQSTTCLEQRLLKRLHLLPLGDRCSILMTIISHSSNLRRHITISLA